ncbi:MAG TPA: cobalamin-dependent protein [Desulfosporosinus sp.]|nr:cobalamin-dependent protein [Desulfosporosinus sp.]
MDNIEQYQVNFLNALLLGDRPKCSEIMQEFKKFDRSIIALYEEVFQKSLYEIGVMWEFNKISVAVEHMASSIVEGLMNELFAEIMSMERKNKQVIISCVAEEEHQVGGKMVADIFEKNSWDAHYLGANTPVDELVSFCDLIKPDLVGLSLSVFTNVPFLLEEISALRKVTNVPIIIGGQALKKLGVELSEKFTDVIYLPNLKTVETYIEGCA